MKTYTSILTPQQAMVFLGPALHRDTLRDIAKKRGIPRGRDKATTIQNISNADFKVRVNVRVR
jgi:hypothetical protein